MQAAIAYIRVSTAGQAMDGVSLDTQRERIGKWCEANEYRLTAAYTDAGVSGKRADNRPELQRAASTKETKEESKGLRWILLRIESNWDEEQKTCLKEQYKACPKLKTYQKLFRYLCRGRS